MWYPEPPPSRWNPIYVFLAGLLIGMVLGWVFQGVVGLLVRLALLIVLLAAAVYLYNFWRKMRDPDSRDRDGIPEADWRDLGSRRRRR
jgi:hypothetical protein